MIDADEWNQYARDAEAEIAKLRAELEIAYGQINRCVDQNKYLESQLGKPDCRTCLHYTGTGYCEVIFGKACEEGSRYIPQRRFESGPLRLYEKEGK